MRRKRIDEVQALDELMAVLPQGLWPHIAWVYPRHYYDRIDVALLRPDGIRIIEIPTSEWISDLTIARICIDAM